MSSASSLPPRSSRECAPFPFVVDVHEYGIAETMTDSPLSVIGDAPPEPGLPPSSPDSREFPSDKRNNVECIRIDHPAPGSSQVHIVAHNTPMARQGYAVCVSGCVDEATLV